MALAHVTTVCEDVTALLSVTEAVKIRALDMGIKALHRESVLTS